ncbi:MAG: hypothetical protein WC294_09300 [Methanoregula sp.]|jgi:hypothetical protein
MVKKSRSSGKAESKALIKEEAVAGKEEALPSGEVETTVSGKESGKIDFFYILAGGGVLIGIILIIIGILRYMIHVL